jgi:ABC-type Na+ efflux pump permease subunit
VAIQAQVARAAALNLSVQQVMIAARPPVVANAPLYFRESGGAVKQESKQGQFMSFIMPFAMLFLLFIVVLIGASPLTTNVVEEKQLRIAEVLLGSVSPFKLMMGKLIGGVGVALTLSVVYLVGGYLGAREFGIAKYLTPGMIGAFVLFTVLATMMYGAMFVAAGSAVTNIKEAQSLITPVMLLVMLPMFFFQPMINDPTGPIARAATFFPFSAPMVTVMRLGIPPGLQVWEIALAAVITLVTTILIVWAAGRVFRIGILMQGQAANFGQIVKWVVSG